MRNYLPFLALFLAALVTGCSENKPSNGPSTEGGKHLLTSEPAGAVGVTDARKQTKDGDDVVIVGRIGGKDNPWGDGQALFWIVDCSKKACNERPDDHCETPWDFCCEDLTDAIATVKIVDDTGATVQTPARKLLGVKELQTVVVRGKAKRDDKGNLTVLATGLYVRPDKK